MSKSLVVVGTGLFAEVAAAYFNKYTEYTTVAYACHASYKESDSVYGLPLVAIESLTESHPADTHDVFVAVGYNQMNQMRARIYQEIKDMGYTCPTFVHPNVEIWGSTRLGDNVFIFEDNTIQPFTSIGSNTMLWSGNHIGHHSSIGSHCFIASHVVISGSCKVDNYCFIGVNATLRDSITIAEKTLIGAGALIMKNTKPKEVYVEGPTRPFKKNSEEIDF